MKFFLTLILFLFSINKISSTILQSFQTTLTPLTGTVTGGVVGNGLRRYVIGITSLESVATSILYAQLNCTKGVTNWLALIAPLSPTSLTRFLITTTDIGNLQGLTLISTLVNDLKLTNLELDGQGMLSFPPGLPINLGGTGSGSIGTQGSSGQGYGYGSFQLPGVGNLVNVVTGLSDNLSFLTTILNQVVQLSQLTNIVTSVVDLQSLLSGLGLGGILGGGL